MPEETAAETAETTTTTETATETATTEKAGLPPELKAIVDKERQNARDAEKARKALEKELNDLRQKSMTDGEKAVEQARIEARQQALTEVGGKVAAAEIRAAAAGRLDAEQLDLLIDNVNVARFIGDDGDVDREAVARFVDGIAPKPGSAATVLDLGQGARGTATTALNGDPLLADLKSKLGIS